MTVILLDPLHPTMVPLDAIEFLRDPVEFTEEVPVSVRWRLTRARDTDSAGVLVSTDPKNETVVARIAAGETVISAQASAAGSKLVEAVQVMDRLWGYGGWEVNQTHDSLRPYLLEETYELLDAIGAEEPVTIKEELGDLLLQVLFHSRIAQASDKPFTVDDVAATLVAKLAHRSPHLGDVQVAPIDVRAQERAWEERKTAEKARRSCMDGIALAQPALALAEKILDRSAKAGFPKELVPSALRSVTLGGAGSAEEELRKSALAFARRIRAAEDAAEKDRGRRKPLLIGDWKKYW
ncbi:MazG family protein [Antrihabitans cavernicola]|uniref:MazG family protein n=1 Tax=Antrihabitans cavernicola TaxID=2495913 RepID=A0A5A7SCH0_9NOCA|nr:MazG family protein [Spelaeibacter cavernicola]KAA0023850.1 MazG family protein [Spelaeibacter cavernicola]